MFSAAIIAARPAWPEALHERLLPGAHVILLTADEVGAVEARKKGFELRDTLLLLWPQTASFGFLFRKPLSEDTVAEQLDATTTGILNIAACRIATSSEDAKAMERCNTEGSGRMYASSSPIGTFVRSSSSGALDTSKGRWPSNVALIHGPTCRRVGEVRIEGHKGYPNGPGGSSSQFSQKGTPTTRKDAWAGHADADGKETITLWDCQADCPASLLDRQSGLRSRGKTFGGDVAKPPMSDMSYGDSGGAARFYPQFATPWEFLDWLRVLMTIPGTKLLEEL